MVVTRYTGDVDTPHAQTFKHGGVDGGVLCRVAILEYANVACLCCLLFPTSHVEFKKNHVPCHNLFKPMSPVTKVHVPLSNLRNGSVAGRFKGSTPINMVYFHGKEALVVERILPYF